jgi:hypothetical protein
MFTGRAEAVRIVGEPGKWSFVKEVIALEFQYSVLNS